MSALMPSSPLRLVSYNIRKAVGLDWQRKPERILAILQDINADIVVLQEADKRLSPRMGVLPQQTLKKELGYETAPLSTNGVSHGWHGIAVLFKSHLRCLHVEQIDIPHLEPRGAVRVDLEYGDGKIVHVIGLHLGLTRDKRRDQLAYLQDYIQAQNIAAQPPMAWVMAGDLNERLDEVIETALKPDFQCLTPGPSFHVSHPTFAFDRFIIHGDIEPQHHYVYQSELTRKGSDHLPIVLEFTL